ncbi:hypothetical protein F2Q68_00020643 [Brassica cretica]|uniref:Uncharacterized protein n=1 Tax=Brassica cretica TaxID=69181 RepID=A0A8S9FRA5_BRACR|nr:hypothetical protein F2Q68_00020643 [Brassica cretica]
MTGTRLPGERAQAVRSLSSLLNYVRLDPRKGGYVASQGFCSVLEDFVEAVGGFLQVPAAGELLHEFVAENREGGYGPGG